MVKMKFRILIAAITAGVTGACATDLPKIQIVDGADSVTVSSSRSVVSDDCEEIGPMIVEDGMTGHGKWHFDGTQQRLEQKIRNLAVQLNADTVWIDESKSTISYVTEGAKGSIVGSSSVAFRCAE